MQLKIILFKNGIQEKCNLKFYLKMKIFKFYSKMKLFKILFKNTIK